MLAGGLEAWRSGDTPPSNMSNSPFCLSLAPVPREQPEGE